MRPNRGTGNRPLEGENEGKSSRPATPAVFVARVCWLFCFELSIETEFMEKFLVKKAIYQAMLRLEYIGQHITS